MFYERESQVFRFGVFSVTVSPLRGKTGEKVKEKRKGKNTTIQVGLQE